MEIMLKRLSLENFALIDKLGVEFDEGMSVLTGETGAGKSIIVGAIARLMGEKADQDDIRSGCKLAVIEGDFDMAKADSDYVHNIKAELEKSDIEFENNLISIRREIPAGRASKSYINGQPVTLTQLRQITNQLAELYGQHSHQRLLDENNHLVFLDNFAGLEDKAATLTQLYDGWDKSRKELAALVLNREQRKKELELLQFQGEEIRKAKIRIGEEQELLAEKKILDSSLLLAEKSTNILQLLDREDQSILENMGACRKEFARMVSLDKSLEKTGELLDQASVMLDEFRSEVESYQASIPDDPDRQEQINHRLDEIFRLKNKYGGSEESILTCLKSIDDRIGSNANIDEQINELRDNVTKSFDSYFKLASEISLRRQKASQVLSKNIVRELGQLGMPSSKFQFEFIYENDEDGIEWENRKIRPSACGLESGRFLISANPGEPLKPLSKIASGGEISRIMLALKAANRQNEDKTGLLVFDEIDVGIGGITAIAVAEKLELLSKSCQLLVVTHLHQIAAKSRNHYAVEKSAQKSSGRNIISVRKLNKSERAMEIKRMIALPN